MAKETVFQHPPGKHVAVLAYDSVNDRWQAVHADVSGQLSVKVAAAKTPERFAETKSELNPGAGTYNITFTAVPAGQVYTLEGIAAKNQTRAASFLTFWITDGTQYIIVKDAPQTTIARFEFVSFSVTMQAGDYVIVQFAGTVAGDDLYASIWGRKLPVVS